MTGCAAALSARPLLINELPRDCGISSHPPAHFSDYTRRMNSTILSSLPGHGQLRRLVALRSVAIASQLLTLAAGWKILELELDWQPMLVNIATLASVNLLSWLRLRSDQPASNLELFVQLCTDVFPLSILF